MPFVSPPAITTCCSQLPEHWQRCSGKWGVWLQNRVALRKMFHSLLSYICGEIPLCLDTTTKQHARENVCYGGRVCVLFESWPQSPCWAEAGELPPALGRATAPETDCRAQQGKGPEGLPPLDAPPSHTSHTLRPQEWRLTRPCSGTDTSSWRQTLESASPLCEPQLLSPHT